MQCAWRLWTEFVFVWEVEPCGWTACSAALGKAHQDQSQSTSRESMAKSSVWSGKSVTSHLWSVQHKFTDAHRQSLFQGPGQTSEYVCVFSAQVWALGLRDSWVLSDRFCWCLLFESTAGDCLFKPVCKQWHMLTQVSGCRLNTALCIRVCCNNPCCVSTS